MEVPGFAFRAEFEADWRWGFVWAFDSRRKDVSKNLRPNALDGAGKHTNKGNNDI